MKDNYVGFVLVKSHCSLLDKLQRYLFRIENILGEFRKWKKSGYVGSPERNGHVPKYTEKHNTHFQDYHDVLPRTHDAPSRSKRRLMVVNTGAGNLLRDSTGRYAAPWGFPTHQPLRTTASPSLTLLEGYIGDQEALYSGILGTRKSSIQSSHRGFEPRSTACKPNVLALRHRIPALRCTSACCRKWRSPGPNDYRPRSASFSKSLHRTTPPRRLRNGARRPSDKSLRA